LKMEAKMVEEEKEETSPHTDYLRAKVEDY
jgi:hypothetical protein